MGKISKVLYTEIDPSVYSAKDAGESYFHQNMLGVHEMFDDGYVNHELKQTHVRNKCIGEAAEKDGISGRLKMNSIIFGVSSMKNKAVAIVEV